MQDWYKKPILQSVKPFLIFFLILILINIVLAENLVEPYNDPITYSMGDLRWCRQYGVCTLGTLTVDYLTVYNLSVIGQVFNVTVNLVTWNITDSFNVAGNFTVDTPTFHIDSTNNRVGIGTVTPTVTLDIAKNQDTTLRIRATTTNIQSWDFLNSGLGMYITPVTSEGDVFFRDQGNTVTLQVDNSANDVLIPNGDLIVSGSGDSSFAGNVGIGNSSPAYKLTIGSTDASDQIGIYHDNTDAYMKWNDGRLYLETDEGTNTDTRVRIRGKGTGQGYLQVYDEDNNEYFEAGISSGRAQFLVGGASPVSFDLQATADAPIRMFSGAQEGEIQELQIYGYRTGDGVARRSLQIGVGVDANDTASFDGVSNYYFDGNVGIGNTIPNSTLDVSGNVTIRDTLKLTNGTTTWRNYVDANGTLTWEVS